MSTDFFEEQLKQQMLEANAGNTTIMQALVGEVGKSIVSGGETVQALDALSAITEMNKSSQLNTIEIMKAFRSIDSDDKTE